MINSELRKDRLVAIGALVLLLIFGLIGALSAFASPRLCVETLGRRVTLELGSRESAVRTTAQVSAMSAGRSRAELRDPVALKSAIGSGSSRRNLRWSFRSSRHVFCEGARQRSSGAESRSESQALSESPISPGAVGWARSRKCTSEPLCVTDFDFWAIPRWSRVSAGYPGDRLAASGDDGQLRRVQDASKESAIHPDQSQKSAIVISPPAGHDSFPRSQFTKQQPDRFSFIVASLNSAVAE